MSYMPAPETPPEPETAVVTVRGMGEKEASKDKFWSAICTRKDGDELSRLAVLPVQPENIKPGDGVAWICTLDSKR